MVGRTRASDVGPSLVGSADVITGGAGFDSMYGDAGNDTLWGRDGGNDFFDGGADTDTAEEDLLPLDPDIFTVEVVNRA